MNSICVGKVANMVIQLGFRTGSEFAIQAFALNVERPISLGVAFIGVIIVGAALIALLRKLN